MFAGTKIRLVKPFRYGLRVFEVGEEGTIVEPDHPFTFAGESVYTYYVKFPNHPPVGVRAAEIEELERRQQ